MRLLLTSLSALLAFAFVIRVQDDTQSSQSLFIHQYDGEATLVSSPTSVKEDVPEIQTESASSFVDEMEKKYVDSVDSAVEEFESDEGEGEEVVDEDDKIMDDYMEEEDIKEEWEKAPAKPDILQIIYNTPELSYLAELIKERPALAEALATADNELTLFAPTNDAFKSHRPNPSQDAVTQVLLYRTLSPFSL